jgi:ABC-2 type transport system permease protein
VRRHFYLACLRLARIGLAGWAIGIALYALLLTYLYPSVSASAGRLIQQYIESMPEQLKAAIGVAGKGTVEMFFTDGTYDFRAWVNTEYLTWLPLLLGIYAVIYCGGLVSREVERGTMDMLLSQPLRRSSFLLSKFSAFATLVAGVILVSYATLSLGSLGIDVELDYRYLALAHVVALLFALAIAGYSTLASCLLLEPGKSVAVPGLVTALIFFLNMLAPSIESATWLQKGSLFYYFDPFAMMFRGEVSWAGVGVYLGVMLGSLILAIVVFQRKDIVR